MLLNYRIISESGERIVFINVFFQEICQFFKKNRLSDRAVKQKYPDIWTKLVRRVFPLFAVVVHLRLIPTAAV